jgi:hypothetical protein
MEIPVEWAETEPLVGFGLDSLIEVTSGATLLWRLRHDLDISRREQVERIALRMVGGCFVALAWYILYESSAMLTRHVPPQSSIAGIVIAAISVIVMPFLARAKRRVAGKIGSGAMHADSKQADFCSLPFRDFLFFSLGWPAVACVVRLVVDGSGCRAGDGSDHREGRHQWTPCRVLLRPLRV